MLEKSFQSRVQAEQAKVDLLLTAHPELRDKKWTDHAVLPASTDLTRVTGLYPPIEGWPAETAWMSNLTITVSGSLILEFKANQSSDAESTLKAPFIQALKLDIKQVALVRPNYDATKLAQAVADVSTLKGKWIITDLIICRNLKLRKADDEENASRFQNFFLSVGKGEVTKARFGPFLLVGDYLDVLPKGHFTPSSQGDFLVNTSTQIIGYLCEQIP